MRKILLYILGFVLFCLAYCWMLMIDKGEYTEGLVHDEWVNGAVQEMRGVERGMR